MQGLCLPAHSHPLVTMPSHIDANGETASLKKRKRGPKDEASPSLKRHRPKAKHLHQANGRQDNEEVNGVATQVGQIVPAENATGAELYKSPAEKEIARQGAAQWKLSSPMGGRMLDIDPMFSEDEKSVL